MAQIETWLNQDLQQPVQVQYLNGNVFSLDNQGNIIGVNVFDNGEPANLSGTVAANVIRSDGATVAVSGTLSGNKASVALPQSAYAVPGVISIVLKLTTSGVVTTLAAVVANVYQSSTDSTVDPGTIIPSIETLIAAIEAAVASIPADYSSLWKSLAPAFDSSKSYRPGQYCTYNGKLYRFIASHSGNWVSSDATSVNIGNEFCMNIGNRLCRFVNLSVDAVNSLTMTRVSGGGNYTYTITKNKSFTIIGAFDNLGGLVRIGDTGYLMPNSFSGEVSTSQFAYVCFDRTDTTTATWQIVNSGGFRSNTNLVPICILYNNYAFFYDDNLRVLFTNSFEGTLFQQYYGQYIAAAGSYDFKLNNAMVLIRGTANYIPGSYKVVFTKPVFSPSSNLGSFDQNLSNDTVEVDWSQESNPSYARCIYYDSVNHTLFALYSGNATEAQLTEYRINKSRYPLICIVYDGTFVYTCGSAVSGKWFVNGNDIYSGAAKEFPPDLYKTFKKVGVVGDSLSVGYMYNKSTSTATTRMLPYSWVKQVMNDAGVPWLNLGTSGQSVLTWCTNATYGLVQAQATGNKCQMYIIGLGENDQSDSARHVDLGTPSDIVDDYTHVATTYYGGYARIIQLLKHINPDCKIFCLTNPRTGGNARAEYNVAVRYIAGTYYTPSDNVFLVDLANNDSSLFNGNTFLPVDASTITGGHYSAIGYTRIGTIIEEELTKAIEANQAYFINVAFVPYDTSEPTPDTMTE